MTAPSDPTQNRADAPTSYLSKDVAAGVPWTLASKALLLVVGFGIPVLHARLLGPDGLGLLALCKVLSEFLLLICGLGLSTSILRFVPELASKENYWGIRRVLTKSAILQIGMFALIALVAFSLRESIASWFDTSTSTLVALALVLTFAGLVRDFVFSAYTAMFWVRSTAVFSVVQGILWLAILAVSLPKSPTVDVAVAAQAVPLILTAFAGLVLMVQWFSGKNRSGAPYGVGKRRILLNVGLPSVMNGLAGMLLRQHTELFFLGLYASSTVVGYYELGCGLPLMLITFLPMTLQQLLTSGFAQAYARTPECLGDIIKAYYRVLILTILPLSIFGMFFSPEAVPVIYGEPMRPAGPIASFFCGFHTLSLIAAPLSLALVAKEKVLNTLPLIVLQGVVNLILDYVLIVNYGVLGAAMAVLATWVLTIPLRLYVVGRLVGGVFFPTFFFLKYCVVLVGIAFLVYALLPHDSIGSLFVSGGLYVVFVPTAIRLLRLVKRDELKEIYGMGFTKLNWLLDIVVEGERA